MCTEAYGVSSCGRRHPATRLHCVTTLTGQNRSGVWRPDHRLTLSPIAACLSLASIMDTTRDCYSGSSRKLVVALDIGTTFSGAAYAFLDPGQVPQIRSVTRQVFPLFIGSVTDGDGIIQVPEQSESWVCESSLCVILRSLR